MSSSPEYIEIILKLGFFAAGSIQVAFAYSSLLKGPVQSKSMFISIDQLPKMSEFHTIIVHKYSSVDFI